jgi:hypothetical protein
MKAWIVTIAIVVGWAACIAIVIALLHFGTRRNSPHPYRSDPTARTLRDETESAYKWTGEEP